MGVVRPLFRTTISDGHVHFWMPGDRFTTMQRGHRHRVSGGIALPVSMGQHSHIILA
ncbi:hypothetical protein LCGC14_1584170 [marine sediment metagenome]|uniref:Uncharacterized protein n=1 Tax=marine sediment metagenome TaxID=412755 RepID=A0A0F9LG95_9ZZZZ